jgi:predicted nucleic acid-binding protein
VILVDTSVWIDHLHRASKDLVEVLERGEVLTHPMVIGELALGSIRDRDTVLSLLARLRSTVVAGHDEVLAMVTARRLHGRGLSLVDAHLLASAHLTPECRIWTRDKRLGVAAAAVSVAWSPRDRDDPAGRASGSVASEGR